MFLRHYVHGPVQAEGVILISDQLGSQAKPFDFDDYSHELAGLSPPRGFSSVERLVVPLLANLAPRTGRAVCSCFGFTDCNLCMQPANESETYSQSSASGVKMYIPTTQFIRAFFHRGINGGIRGGIGVYSHSIPIPFPLTRIEPE